MDSGNFEAFFQSRQDKTLGYIPDQDYYTLTKLVDEQEKLTQAILKKMVPADENRELLRALEAVIIETGGVVYSRLYRQGVRDGSRLAQLLLG